jgi:hypothetical protein
MDERVLPGNRIHGADVKKGGLNAGHVTFLGSKVMIF